MWRYCGGDGNAPGKTATVLRPPKDASSHPRVPLEDIDQQEHDALEHAIIARLGIELADFTPAGKDACDNAEL